MKNVTHTGKFDPAQWYAFPNNRNAKLLIDLTGNVKFANHLWHPYSAIGKLSRALLSMIPRTLLRLALPKYSDQDELQNHHDISCKILNSEELHIHFSTGTPGPHRKITAQISDENRIIAYVKIAASTSTKKLIESEKDALFKLNESSPASAEIPQLLGWHENDTKAYLFLSAPASRPKQRTKHIETSDLHFLEWMANGDKTEVNISSFLNDAYLSSVGETYHNEVLKKIIEDSTIASTRIFRSESITTYRCHGDFTPWNTLTLPNNKPFVFDWEYATDSGPPLFDLLYRIYMPARLLDGISSLAMTKLLTETINQERFSGVVKSSGISKSHNTGYIILFYAWMACRESANDSGVSEYLNECIRYAMIMAKQPGYLLKIFVSAYACEPDKGSEPGVGWNWANQISLHNETWVVTKKNNRESIEKELKINPNPNINFIYVDPPRWLTFWKKKERGIRTYYYLWQLSAILPAIRLNRRIRFDLSHHVTFVNDWIWSFLSLLPVPFIWGPVGSNVTLPLHLLPGLRDKLRDRLRIVIQTMVRWLDPLWWISVVRASSIMVINNNITKLYPLCLIADKKMLIEPGIGIDIREKSETIHKLDKQVLFVGHHIPIKGGVLLIEAFKSVVSEIPNAQLKFIGEGIDENKLKKLVKEYSLEENIIFEPWQPRESVRQAMEKASIFAFPSLEGGGMVVLEAMSAATPVVCLNFGGPGAMIDDTSGIRVPVRDREAIICDLADAIIKLLVNQELRETLGKGAKKRVLNNFTWSRKGNIARKQYLSALELTSSSNEEICK